VQYSTVISEPVTAQLRAQLNDWPMNVTGANEGAGQVAATWLAVRYRVSEATVVKWWSI